MAAGDYQRFRSAVRSKSFEASMQNQEVVNSRQDSIYTFDCSNQAICSNTTWHFIVFKVF